MKRILTIFSPVIVLIAGLAMMFLDKELITDANSYREFSLLGQVGMWLFGAGMLFFVLWFFWALIRWLLVGVGIIKK